MKNAKIVLVSMFILSITFISCQDPSVPEQDAVKMTKEELKNTIGYEWFNGYWNLYQPDQSIVNQISQIFNPDEDKFVLFIEPSCTCRDLVSEPADLVKVLDVANVSSDYYEIYSMGSAKSKHPFENKIHFDSLPQVYLLQSGEFVYSILDTFQYYESRNFKKIETIILEALQKN